MRNILVTGGAGFIGSHTVVELVNAGYRPVIIDNFSNSDRSVLPALNEITGQQIICYEGDFQDQKLLAKVFAKENIDGVIHFAAFKAVGESVKKPLEYYRNNVAGLVSLLEATEQHKVPNLVFSSSCTVYGEPDKLPITEESPNKPAASPYGATKQMCETIIHDATIGSNNLRSLSLRYFNPIGAHSSALIGELPIGIPANLVPFVTQAAAGIRKQLTVFGNDYPTPDGTCIRDYIHVVDLAKAHVKALQHVAKQKTGYYDTCNVGTGKGSSVLEVIKTFEKVTGQKVPYKVGSRRAGDIIKIYAAVDKSKKMLGWQTEKSLADALTDAWHWQQNINKKDN
jgi:UDP-glucose 4-epimerase